MLNLTHPIIIRYWVRHYAAQPEPTETTGGKLGAVVGEINKVLKTLALKPDEVESERRWILGWLFGPEDETPREFSARELTPQQIFALGRWIGARKVGDKWVTRKEFPDELFWVRSHAHLYHESAQRYEPPLTIAQVMAALRVNEEDFVAKNPVDFSQVGEEIEEGGVISHALQTGYNVVASTQATEEEGKLQKPLPEAFVSAPPAPGGNSTQAPQPQGGGIFNSSIYIGSDEELS